MNYKKTSKIKYKTLKKNWKGDDGSMPTEITLKFDDYQSIEKLYNLHKLIELNQYMYGDSLEIQEMKQVTGNLLSEKSNFKIKYENKGNDSIIFCFFYMDWKLPFSIDNISLNDIALKNLEDLSDAELGYIFYYVLQEYKIMEYNDIYSYSKVNREKRISLLKGELKEKYLECLRTPHINFIIDAV